MALKVRILFARLVMIPQIIGVTHSKSCVVEEKNYVMILTDATTICTKIN